jgi:hypothetical protein
LERTAYSSQLLQFTSFTAKAAPNVRQPLNTVLGGVKKIILVFKSSIVLLTVGFASLAAGETCAIVYEEPGGTFGFQLLEHLKVSAIPENGTLPEFGTSFDDSVISITCSRTSIVPVKSDYLVLKTGYSLFLVAQDIRMQILEGDNQYIAKMFEGPQPTRQEMIKIVERIDEFSRAKFGVPVAP